MFSRLSNTRRFAYIFAAIVFMSSHSVLALQNPALFSAGEMFGGESADSNVASVSAFSLSFSTDLVSRYVWRGVEFGVNGNTGASTPHFQPTAVLSFDAGSSGVFNLGFWGSYGFDGNYSENDLSIGYAATGKSGTFTITCNDYYYPYLGIPFSNTESDGKGAHTVDVQFAYTMPESFPLSLLVSNNIFNDFPHNKSLYFEGSYPVTIAQQSVTLFAGIAKGPSIWHSISSEKFELINVGFKISKTIKITEYYSLPTGISWVYNAHLRKTVLVFKVTI